MSFKVGDRVLVNFIAIKNEEGVVTSLPILNNQYYHVELKNYNKTLLGTHMVLLEHEMTLIPEFKVGDVVKVNTNGVHSSYDGQVGIVLHINKVLPWPYSVSIPPINNPFVASSFWTEDELELVNED